MKEEWRERRKAADLACVVCLVREKFREFGDLCLCRISFVAFLTGDGIREMEDREQGKDHVNRYVPWLKLSMIQGALIANTRDECGKMEMITIRAQGCLTQASRPVVCLFV